MKKAYEKYFFLLKGDIKRGIPTLILIFMISSFFDLIGISLIGLLLLLINDFDAVLKKHPHIFSFLLKTFDKKEAIFIVAMLLLASFILKAVWSVYSQKKNIFFLVEINNKIKNATC